MTAPTASTIPTTPTTCGDLVPGCALTFTGSTEEILASVATHARHDHGMTDVSPELVAQVRGATTRA